jgi:hypothetical protein
MGSNITLSFFSARLAKALEYHSIKKGRELRTPAIPYCFTGGTEVKG